MKITALRRRSNRPPTTAPAVCAPWCDFHDTESDTDIPGGICVGKPLAFDGGSVNLVRGEHGVRVSFVLDDGDATLRPADAMAIGHLLINTAGAGFAGGAR